MEEEYNMKEIKNQTVKTWYILKEANHHGFVEVGQVLMSGQDTLETFKNEDEWISRLKELNIVRLIT